jgi:hypothetical protein
MIAGRGVAAAIVGMQAATAMAALVAGRCAKLLWSPLPQDWEMGAPLPERRGATLTIPHEVLEHRAVLTLPDGTPFSEVVETYTGEVLAFPEPLWP